VLLAPRETAVLYGPTEIVAEASCPPDTAVLEMTLLVDGEVVARSARPPYQTVWDAGGSFAAHLVVARLIDRQGLVATAALATQGSAIRESVRVTSSPIDRVELSVAVTDRDGRPIRGLTKDDFIVTEGGREQRIDAVQPERRPLSVAVLVDVSSSTKDLWEPLTRAAPAFARTLGPEDVAKVIAFSGPAYLVQDFTLDVQAIAASMARFRAWGGGTSLYDTLASAGVELAWGRGGRQAVVLLTDGIDTLSRIDAPRLRNYLRRTDVAVETLLLRPPGSTSYPGYGRFVRDIKVLARETGGRVRQLGDPSQMEAAFRELGEGLQNRYHVTYHSDRAVRSGAWRSLAVKVRRRGAVVRTRGGVLGSRDIVDHLLQDLHAGDAAARRKAAEWLGAVGAGAAAEPLLRALEDRSPEVRAAAAASLGRIRDPRAIPALVGLLGDPDGRTSRAALEALQGFGPAAVPALIGTLERGRPSAQVDALRALAAIGDARAIQAITRLALPPPPATASPTGAAHEPRGRPDADPRVRAWALWSLASMGRPDAAPALAQAAADPDPAIRGVAARALGELGSLEALPPLARAAGDEAPEVRREALASLERILEPGAEELVSSSGRLPAGRLVRLADDVFDPLLAAFRAPEGPAAEAAIQAFSSLAGERVIEAGALALEDPETRAALLGRWRVLRDRSVEALATIAFPPPAAPAADPEGAGGRAARDRPRVVGDGLRAAALAALGASGSPAAVAILLGGLAEPEGTGLLAEEAREALVRLTGETFARHAFRAIGGRPRQRGAELGRTVLGLGVDGLLRLLDDGDSAGRQEAARALGESKPPEAIPALHRTSGDQEPDPMVRAAARRALHATIVALAREGLLGAWAASGENAALLVSLVRRAADEPDPDAEDLLQAIRDGAPGVLTASRPPPTAP
jgi:VWFA-related protein